MEDSLSGSEIFYLMAAGIAVMLAFAMAFIIFTNRTQRRLMTERMRQKELELKQRKIFFTAQSKYKKRKGDVLPVIFMMILGQNSMSFS